MLAEPSLNRILESCRQMENRMDDEVRIVVVDDMPDAAQALSDLLTTSGYVVQIAPGGEEALALIDRWRPHCVLLDVNMPGVSGLELARTMRRLYGDNIVLIAVTGGADDDPLVAETFACVDHYLRKPDYLRALMKVLPPLHT